MSGKKELFDLMKIIKSQGWQVKTRRGGHLALYAPQGGVYFVAQSPSDHRALMNVRSALRRMGADV